MRCCDGKVALDDRFTGEAGHRALQRYKRILIVAGPIVPETGPPVVMRGQGGFSYGVSVGRLRAHPPIWLM
jgi:hypothetical protein